MAVMASPAAENAPPDQAPLKMTPVSATESVNGTAEVNGHTSPVKDLESVLNHKDAKQPSSESTDANHEQNSEVFSANQHISVDEKEDKRAQETQPIDSSDAEEKVVRKDEDVDIPDAPAPEAATTEDEKGSAKEEDDEKVTRSDEAEKPEEPKTESEEEQSAGITKTVADVTLDEKASPAPAPALPTSTEDVAMSDAAPQRDPSSSLDNPDDSDDVNPTTGAAPATPAEESNTQPSISAALESSQMSAAVPATVDTSMSDATPSSKVAREREDDVMDEPAAKRPKIDTAAKKTATTKGEPMDAELASNGQSFYLPNGEPKPLGDPSLDDTEITEWQTKCIRIALGGVKKTKAGMHFRLPVEHLWPGVWADYSAKVPEPTDIHTMELKLKGELPRYHTMAEFKKDLDRLVGNAVLFNGENHEISNAARNARENVLQRMQAYSAVGPAKPEKKELPKHHAKRNPEPRAAAQPATPQPPPPPEPSRRQSKSAATSPTELPVEAAVFAIPPNNNGVPIIRRDSTKTADKPKRTINPPKSKDLPYESKRKKKLSPELRFCETVLEELKKSKYWELNNPFLVPVDPVALNIPNYHKVVKKPMDLGTMTIKLDRGEYSSAKEFEKDFNLIIKNCKDFNGEGHVVTDQANALMSLFKKQWAQKEDYVSKHSAANAHAAPTAGGGSASRAKDDTEDEDAESEPEPEPEETKQTSALLATFQKRLEEEQKKVDAEINSPKPDATVVAVAQAVISGLQLQIIQERNKLREEAAKKPTKPKKAAKKAANGGNSGAGGSKKANSFGVQPLASARKPAKKSGGKRKIGSVEKEIVTSGIGDLENKDLEKAIEIIKKDTGQGENDSGELELDIEALSDDAVSKLYDIVIKAFPSLKVEKEKEQREKAQQSESGQAASASTPAKSKGGGGGGGAAAANNKGKKNKPMSKAEQERKIQHLTQLRAAAQRQGSGSQEPMESIEGNGNAPATGSSELMLEPDHDSEDEESSEEE